MRKQLDDQMGSRCDLSTINEDDFSVSGVSVSGSVSVITTSRAIDDKQKEKSSVKWRGNGKRTRRSDSIMMFIFNATSF